MTYKIFNEPLRVIFAEIKNGDIFARPSGKKYLMVNNTIFHTGQCQRIGDLPNGQSSQINTWVLGTGLFSILARKIE